MTHHQLGQGEQAREALEQANVAAGKALEKMDTQVAWMVPLMLELLRSEAEALIATETGAGEPPADPHAAAPVATTVNSARR